MKGELRFVLEGTPADLEIPAARSSSTTIIPYLQVLSATHSSGASRTKDDSPKTHVLISAIASKPSSAKLGLWKLDGEVTGGKARAWCEELEKRAYGGELSADELRKKS